MKTLVIRGKYTGLELEVAQWCNDWFMCEPPDDASEKDFDAISRTPFSPTQLAFNITDWNKIVSHKNNGVLFDEFEKHELNGKLGAFEYTFKRKKI